MKTLVCLSGLLCDERLWKDQQKALQGTYQCLFPSISTHESVQDLASSILETTPERFCLAGMSAGSVVALEMLRQTEKSADKQIEKLALIAANPHALTDEIKNSMLQSIATIETTGMEQFVMQDLLPHGLGQASQNNHRIRSLIVEMAKSVGLKAYKNQVAMLNTRSGALELLARTDVPILAVCGKEDRKCPPAFHEIIAQTAPHGSLVSLEKTGHYINLENPESLNHALLQFLTS